jgi:N,N'-diacetyllegionaminate synthase
MDNMVNEIILGDHRVGPGQPCLIIAEAGVNHNGNVGLARQLIDVAKKAGADAVKFQTFKAEKVVSSHAPKAEYQLAATDADESQLDMIKKLELSYDQFGELYDYCRQQGILFLSTPFDAESADFLEHLGVAAFKVASGEITNLPFLRHIARKGRPMIVSTGMSYLSEVEVALRTIAEAGQPPVAVLHCVSNYPAAPGDVNLRTMQTLASAFEVPVGFSDHTVGVEIAFAAAAVGACIVEKHFTLDRTLPGPDHQASLEPAELRALVQGIRHVEAALGHGRKEPAASEANTAAVARRSLVAAQDIPAGAVLTEGMIAIMRPGTGLPPTWWTHVIGRTARVAILAGTLITLEMLA